MNKTPSELWNGEKPKLDHLKSFGSIAFSYVPAEKRTKWDPHAKQGVFVGYDEHSTGYRILDPLTNRITISRTVEFIGNEHFSGYERTEKKNIEMGIQNEIEVSCENNEENIFTKIEANENIRKRRKVENQIQCGENQIENEEFNENQIRRSTVINKGIPAPKLRYMATNAFPREPKSFEDLMSYPECEKSNWQKAIHDELESFNEKRREEENLYLLIYVDDISICNRNLTIIKALRKKLNNHFEALDLGDIHYLLGISIFRDEDGNYLVDQEDKINKMVNEFGLTKHILYQRQWIQISQINENSKLLPNKDITGKAVGVLLYSSTMTRPNISLAVNYLTRRISQPRETV
ncbi:hypothetical protein JTB14_032790 [Gonioctena quinquepunctata]|nr:hypothetical protein JTB14_032790 [Gonioctena quinquepunctata]